MIPTLSILSMGFTVLVCFGLPIILFFVFRKKYGGRLVPALVGAIVFIVFALLLESMLHGLVLQTDASGNIALLTQHPWLYVLYAIFAAGIFEETGRFVAFSLLKRKYGGIGNALTYGVGHGGIEAILLAGTSMVSNLAFALMVNQGMLGTLLNSAADAEAAAQLESAAGQMQALPSYMFAIAGLERIAAIALHIGLSVIVYYAVVRPGKRWLYPLAILLHALVNLTAAMFQAGLLHSTLLMEAVVFLCAGLVVLIAVRVHKTLKDAPAA